MMRFGSFALASALGFCLVAMPAAAQDKDFIQNLIREAQKGPHPTFNFTPTVPEGPRVPLTVEDAVKAGLEHNLQLSVQRMAPELQDIAVVQARSALFQPTLTADFSRSSQTSTPTSQLQLATGGGATTTGTLSYNASIDQPVPFWGAKLNARFTNSRVASNSNNSVFNPSYNSSWTAQYTQPLLRNRSIDANRRTLVVSRIQRDVSDIQLKAQISNLAADIRNAYWDFVYRIQAVESAQQSYDIATKLVQDNQVRVEVGTLAQIEVVSARAEQASRQQALVAAQNARRTAELALKALIVGGTADPLWAANLDPTDRPDFAPQPIDVEAAIKRALNDRTDIAIARKQIESNDVSLHVLRNALLPDVSLNVTYGTSGVGGTQLVRSSSQLGSQVVQTIPGGIGDALSNLFSNKNPRWTVGVNLNYPIGLTPQETSLARARVLIGQNQSQLKLIELQVARDITNAATNLANSAQSVEAARISRQLSEERLNAEQTKFEVGMSTNYAVVQAQRDLATARDSELNAILGYQRAQVEFDRLQQNGTGTATVIQIN